MNQDMRSKAGAIWMLVAFLLIALDSMVNVSLEFVCLAAWTLAIVLLMQGGIPLEDVNEGGGVVS